MALPGLRDVYYGHVSRALGLTLMFSVSVVYLLTGGSVYRDPTALETGTPLWGRVAAIAGIVLAYALSARSKPSTSFRPQRHRSGARRPVPPQVEPANSTRAA